MIRPAERICQYSMAGCAVSVLAGLSAIFYAAAFGEREVMAFAALCILVALGFMAGVVGAACWITLTELRR